MEDPERIVKFEQRGRVAILTLDRPPVNALSMSMYRTLAAEIDRVSADETIHVAILTAAGGKVFCGGADIKEIVQLDPAARRSRHEEVTDFWIKLSTAAIPIICAVNGAAPGGGSVLASLCDYRIAADNAVFSYPEIDRGTAGGGGIFLRKTGVVSGMVRKMLYTGAKYSAAEALKMNIVDSVVPLDGLMPAALELGDEIASKPRQALVVMKRAILAAEAEADWIAGYRATHGFSAELTGNAEIKQKMQDFLQR